MKCDFCSKQTPPGRGIIFVRRDDKIFRFCSSKCERNWGMKRKPQRRTWSAKPKE
ncbi:MAG: 50S ribosomal protein L24e [Candidatus Altiarchaeota archaeon]|nr:50S ribosomal protein L24e [Candidatus Altiarchaeota archaeon]